VCFVVRVLTTVVGCNWCNWLRLLRLVVIGRGAEAEAPLGQGAVPDLLFSVLPRESSCYQRRFTVHVSVRTLRNISLLLALRGSCTWFHRDMFWNANLSCRFVLLFGISYLPSVGVTNAYAYTLRIRMQLMLFRCGAHMHATCGLAG
jgi:hypothetical protein